MSRLSLVRTRMYRTIARQLHGVVPCWLCGEPVAMADATLEHIKPLSEGGSSHIDNLAISHGACNHRRHAKAPQAAQATAPSTAAAPSQPASAPGSGAARPA